MRKPWYTYLYIKSPIAKILWGIATVIIMIGALGFAWAADYQRMDLQTANWEGRSIEKGAEIFANNCQSCHGPEGKGGTGPALHSKYFFTQRLNDIGWSGSLRDYVELTVAAGRPANPVTPNSQFQVVMPTWSSRFGGPLRDDQVEHVTNYVLNWEESALQQTDEEDPWIPFANAPSKLEGAAQAAPVSAAPEENAEPRSPQQLFQEMLCNTCHMLDQDQTAQNRGPVAPYFGNLAENAAQRVAGQTAEEYVHESIVNPNAYIVEGYLPNVMPQNFAERMSEEEINALVQWLLDPNRPQ